MKYNVGEEDSSYLRNHLIALEHLKPNFCFDLARLGKLIYFPIWIRLCYVDDANHVYLSLWGRLHWLGKQSIT
jgi:hypothetical protein